MTVAFGVVAHTARQEQAARLALSLPAAPWPPLVCVDDGTLGPVANHRRVWAGLDRLSTDWVCVLEDDARPVDEFAEQLHAALAVAASPVVSLYLGTGRPPGVQAQVRRALGHAEQAGACWVTAPRMLHAVGICLRSNLVADMLAATGHLPPRIPADQRWDRWLTRRRLPVAYAVPSLVDHADTPTLVQHPDRQPRTEPRRAWRTGTRTQWTRAAVHLT